MDFDTEQLKKKAAFNKHFSAAKVLILAHKYLEAIPLLENAARHLELYAEAWLAQQKSVGFAKRIFGARCEFAESNLARVRLDLSKCFLAVKNYEQAHMYLNLIQIVYLYAGDQKFVKENTTICKDLLSCLASTKDTESQGLLSVNRYNGSILRSQPKCKL